MEPLFTDHIFLSRLQFALVTMFHIIWPVLTIGLAMYIFLTELVWVRTGRKEWYQQARFWSRFFPLIFAMGVISGIPLEFQFGTNWSLFSEATGGFLGQILSVEAMSGFLLESIFLYLMVAGWQRFSPQLHLFATGMVVLGSILSAFWIMVANSFMQTPRGGQVENGVFVVSDWFSAIFNPDLFSSFPHMLLACLTGTAFVLAGVAAWHLLRSLHTEFYLRVFKTMVAVGLFLALIQAGTGDLSGQNLSRYQPAKLAATEAFWDTNQAGQGAAWSIFAWPDVQNERNSVELRIPYVLSMLATHNPFGQVIGLKDIPRNERPPIVLIFYSFRVMVIIGMLMILAGTLAALAWRRGLFHPERIASNRKLLKFFIWLAPLSIVSIWAGWIMREVGRQPWVLYGMLRTKNMASPLTSEAVGLSLFIFIVAGLLLFGVFLFFARQILRKGPDNGTLPPESCVIRRPS
ncbi:cytochrome ubiquinol oxidase subunit I [Desulfovibrio gilichinskyi]|nr:cytochrome ubiquinol oxidase subunit I [Desulfovibrio gilichinskyi]